MSGAGIRLAAVLVGTNSVRSLVVEAESPHAYRVVDSEKVTTRIGEGLAIRGELAPEAMERTMDALRRLNGIAHAFRPRETRAVATSAVREARNGAAFARRVREELGLPIEVLSGDEEADLAWRSAAAEFDLSRGASVVLDQGGGSAELVVASDGRVASRRSLPIGALRIAERFVDGDPMSPAAYARMRSHLRELIRGCAERGAPGDAPGARAGRAGRLVGGRGSDERDGAPGAPVVVGSGGSVTALARVAVGASLETHPSIHGLSIPRRRLKATLRRLRAMRFEERRRLPGLSPERAEIIVPGAAAVLEVLRAAGARRLYVNELGLRQGMILDLLDRVFPPGPSGGRVGAAPADDWLRGVLSFAETMRFEKDHSLHVAYLAGLAFDALAPLHALPARDRDLLQAAAILHDIGYSVGAKGHHRHAYDLIHMTRLPGVTPREVRLIALVVRYHRGARPKGKHPEFAGLAREDRGRVERLAAILRVADGLDRGHAARVGRVDARVGADAVELLIEARGNVDLEIWGAERKRDLFESVFERNVRIRIAGESLVAQREGATP